MDSALIEAVRDVAVASDLDHQILRLRKVKNDIVGHALRKELVITHGLLAALENVLASAAKTSGKRSEQQDWTSEDELRLQATVILDTLANGGPSFVSPILLSDITNHLFNALSPVETPSRNVLVSLRTLNSLARSSILSDLSPPNSTLSPLAVRAFNKTNTQRLLQLLKSPTNTASGRQHIELTASLIATICVDDHSRGALTKAGVLEALAALLADFAVHESRSRSAVGTSSALSPRAIREVIDATSAIVKNSNYRAYRLLLSAPFRRVFSSSSIGVDNNQVGRAEGFINTEALLPKVNMPLAKTVTFGSQQFPSLEASSSRYLRDPVLGKLPTSDPLCSWLIHLARCFETPSGRVAALRLLALENTALELIPLQNGAGGKSNIRERQIGLLAIPIAVKLVQDAVTTMNLPNDRSEDVKILREEACAVLAMLIKSSLDLQKVAVEAGAIKHVSLMLRKSFDPVAIARPMWSPQQQDHIIHSNIPSAQMGEVTLPPEIAHVMKIRAGALKALASITQREDSHRKLVIDQGMVVHLIESLVPMTDSSLANLTSASVPCNFNTVSVIVAACEAASSLSRSVSLLRTSLIDAGIAKPIIALLNHPDVDVQIAATNVCCNLVLDFSPMRQDLMAAGAMKTLCEHARWSNPALRVASLWAMKHLVLRAPKAVKIEALEELGPAWLVQTISGEQRNDQPFVSGMGMSTPNAAGQQVDILNAPDTPEMDVDTPDEDLPDEESDSGEIQVDQTGTPYQSSSMRSTLRPNLNALTTLRVLRERENNPVLQSRQESIDVQEQALDFLRNLINSEDAPAMIDHINGVVTIQRIFEIILAKLEPPPPSGSRTSMSSGVKNGTPSQIPAGTPDTIVHSSIHILTHISAASTRHRQLLIAQKPLLRAWMPHFDHRDPQIRVICIWVVINLTWVEDQSDREGARRRATELRNLGVEDKIRALQNDPEVDVRERCKVAMRQLEDLLSPTGIRGR